MRRSILVLTFLGFTAFNAFAAPQNVDMARITCADYLAMSTADNAVLSAWMSGWFNQKKGYVWIDLNAYARNVGSLRAWCTSNPNQTVMAGLERSTAGQ